MFWFGFWCGVISVLLVLAIIMTVFMILSYKGAHMAENDE